MNEGSGTTIADSSLNGLDGTYNGSPADWELINIPDTSFDYSNTPRIVDVAVTALTHLCIPIDPAWGLDGNAVGIPVLAPQINGNNAPCENTQESYTVSSSGTQDVFWSVTNGTILQGQDSTTAIIQWSTAGNGGLTVEQCNFYDTLSVTINTCTAISQLQSDRDFQLYPNPTTGIVNIKSTNGRKLNIIQVFNTIGEKVLDLKNNAEEMTIDLSKVGKGVYLINIIDDQNRNTLNRIVY